MLDSASLESIFEDENDIWDTHEGIGDDEEATTITFERFFSTKEAAEAYVASKKAEYPDMDEPYPEGTYYEWAEDEVEVMLTLRKVVNIDAVN